MRLLVVLVLLLPLAAAEGAFSFDGHIAPGVAACAPALGCRSAQLPQSQIYDAGTFDGVVDAHVTLTWTPASPLAQELRLGVSYDRNGARIHEFVQGASPLVLSRAISVDGALLVWANFPQTTQPAPVWLSHEQGFAMVGSIERTSAAGVH